MFLNIGPMEFVVLAIVGLIVIGPDRLPGLARDAARMLRSLRDMATGARQQLRDELGPEFADIDLRNLNPRTAVQRAVFGDDVPDFGRFNPSAALRDAILGEPAEEAPAPVSMTKEQPPAASANGNRAEPPASANGNQPRPRPRPGPGRRYDTDAT